MWLCRWLRALETRGKKRRRAEARRPVRQCTLQLAIEEQGRYNKKEDRPHDGGDPFGKVSQSKAQTALPYESTARRNGRCPSIALPDLIQSLARYGISAERKSIYADIEALRQFGLDVEFKRERTAVIILPIGCFNCRS